MKDKVMCEKCGAEMIPVDPNKPSGMKCPKCGWGWVTSYFEPKYEDETTYTVFLDEGNSAKKNQLKIISQVMNCNFIKAKDFIGSPKGSLIEGKAYEVDEIIELLKDASMKYHVEPEYPY